MKRTLSTILASTMALSLFASMPAFADGEETTTAPPQPTYLFSADFEGENPLKDFYGATATEADKASKPYNSANVSVATDTGWNSKYLNIIPTDQSNGYAKLFLGKNVEKTGKLVIEYDDQLMLELAANGWGATNAARGLAIQRVNQNRAFVEEVSDSELKLRNLVDYRGSNRKQVDGFDRANYVLNENAANIYDGEVKYGFLTKYNSTEPLLRKRENWEHCKLVIDFTTGEYQLLVDGVLSEKYKEKEAYTKIMKGSEYFDSLVFWALKNGAKQYAPLKIDNIKVYTVGGGNSAFIDTDPITQNPDTGIVTAKFKYAMDSSAIRIYNSDGTDVTKSVTMSQDKKTATITASTKVMKGVYYVKVGNYDGVNYGPAEKEQTVQLNWEGEPRTYLYYEDFENDTVGSAPNSFYDGESDSRYSDKENSVKADKTKVAVKNDSEKGNYAEIITSTQKQAKIFLDREVSRADGTVVLELDIKSKLNGDWYNCDKEILYQKSAIDESNNDTTSSALWFKGSDKGNPFGFNESIYTKMSDKDEDRWKGTNESRLLKYYNDNDSKILRTEDWQHYKLELNMKTGEQQLWLDGKASEIWLDKDLYASVAVEDHKLNGFVFKARYSGTGTATNLQLDNIKVYLKDTADTSPFESIVSEKNGNVVAKFGYAVNAEDLAVYNADGEKIEGNFVMSDDKKTATFTPARSEEDGLYYVQVAKLASGKVTPQTTKEFNYAPGRTKMVISDLTAVSGNVAPKFTLTHTDGEEKNVVMIVAAYKDGKMVKADVQTKTLTTAEIKGEEVQGAPTLTLTEGEADTVKAFAWIGNTYVPIGQSAVYTTLGE